MADEGEEPGPTGLGPRNGTENEVRPEATGGRGRVSREKETVRLAFFPQRPSVSPAPVHGVSPSSALGGLREQTGRAGRGGSRFTVVSVDL